MRANPVFVAVRSLFHRPGFAVAAILLMALGAGANAAMFSLVRGILLRPLPYAQPDRLVAVWPDRFVSNRDIGYFREHARSYEQVAGMAPGFMMALVAEGMEPLRVTGGKVSDNMFATLGAGAILGRTIEPGDGPSRLVVLSYPL